MRGLPAFDRRLPLAPLLLRLVDLLFDRGAAGALGCTAGADDLGADERGAGAALGADDLGADDLGVAVARGAEARGGAALLLLLLRRVLVARSGVACRLVD